MTGRRMPCGTWSKLMLGVITPAPCCRAVGCAAGELGATGRLGDGSATNRRAPVAVHRAVGDSTPLDLDDGSGDAIAVPPPSPTTRSVSSAIGTNTVTWTAVGGYLGGPPTGYEVQYNADATGSYPDASWEVVPECVVLDAGKLSCTHGTPSGYLDKGDKYKYRVRARNAVGRGGWSVPSAEVVVAAGVPTSVDLGTRSSNGENTFSWEFARNGGDIV